MRRNAHTLRRRGSLVRFAATGAVNTILVYAAFSLLMRHHLHYVVACCCSSCVGLASSYLLNRNYTFRAGRPIAPREVATFLLCYALQLLLGILIYAVLIDHLSMRYQLAFPIDLLAVAVFSYTFMDRIVFQSISVQRPHEADRG